MNDLKLLISSEKLFNNAADSIELITFDTNMNSIYVSDHNRIYELSNSNVN